MVNNDGESAVVKVKEVGLGGGATKSQFGHVDVGLPISANLRVSDKLSGVPSLIANKDSRSGESNGVKFRA
jgi:hypothetical protein